MFDENVLKQKNSENTCLVCAASLLGNNDNSTHNEPAEEEQSDWITWYYYGMKDEKGNETSTTSLRDKPIDLKEFGEIYFLIKEFKAPPRDSSEDSSWRAKEILRTYIPDAFSPAKKEPVIRCPRCFSDDWQMVPRKFSLLTGFATNRIDRVCKKCMKRF